MRSVRINDLTFDEFLTPETIASLVDQVAVRINTDYAGKHPLFVCVLNGAFMYASDLFKRITVPAEITFVRLKSYSGTQTTGKITELIPLQQSVEGRDVIIVEDIVDTGLTMHHFRRMLYEQGAASVALTSFLFKSDSLQYEDAKPEYIGKEIPTKFILGYGLDLDEQARNLDAVYILHQ